MLMLSNVVTTLKGPERYRCGQFEHSTTKQYDELGSENPSAQHADRGQETCSRGVETVQPEQSLELTQPTLLEFQAFSRTKSVEVVPGFLEPVYTVDAIYWLNHSPSHG